MPRSARALAEKASLICLLFMPLSVATVSAQDAQPDSARHHGVAALMVSDIHFEPFWDPAKAAELESAPARSWDAILAGPLGADWGVCMNQRSPRAGLLTFEHQGCPQFEDGPSHFGPGTGPT